MAGKAGPERLHLLLALVEQAADLADPEFRAERRVAVDRGRAERAARRSNCKAAGRAQMGPLRTDQPASGTSWKWSESAPKVRVDRPRRIIFRSLRARDERRRRGRDTLRGMTKLSRVRALRRAVRNRTGALSCDVRCRGRLVGGSVGILLPATGKKERAGGQREGETADHRLLHASLTSGPRNRAAKQAVRVRSVSASAPSGSPGPNACRPDRRRS